MRRVRAGMSFRRASLEASRRVQTLFPQRGRVGAPATRTVRARTVRVMGGISHVDQAVLAAGGRPVVAARGGAAALVGGLGHRLLGK